MISQNDGTEYQDIVLNKIKEVYDSNGISDRIVLMSIFHNYRTGAGLRLSEKGYEICKNNSLYEFHDVPLPRLKQTSLLFTSLDRICKSPYYVLGNTLFLSDRIIVTHYTLCGGDFEKIFDTFS